VENSNLPDEIKNELAPLIGEINRLQKFEDARIEQEAKLGQLEAQLNMYSVPSLLGKLSNDPILKTLTGPAKKQIREKHAKVLKEGQGFRNDKNWQDAFNDMQTFSNNGGFVGGYEGMTADEKQRAVLRNADMHNEARRNFLERSEFAFRNKKKDPTGESPDYFMFKEYELRDARNRQLKTTFGDIVRSALKPGGVMRLEKPQREVRKRQERIDEFSRSEETRAFEAYTNERIRLNQTTSEPKTDKAQPKQETEVPEEQIFYGKPYIKVDGGWQLKTQ
jgi:hypothetical protein